MEVKTNPNYMTAIEKNLILAPFLNEEKTGCYCGLCGKLQNQQKEWDGKIKWMSFPVKFLRKVENPTKITDIIPICHDCREDIGAMSIKQYREKIKTSCDYFFNPPNNRAYRIALKYGMKVYIRCEIRRVQFYFEKIKKPPQKGG